ncbi:MAG TPA: DUF6191 domain-containing protein [Candidatus Nanopelagicales bacterium]
MGFLLGMTLPLLVIALFALGMVELAMARRKRTQQPGAIMASTGFDLLQQALYPSKRHELEQRAHEALMADQAEDGAPPRTRIDLERGTAHVVPPSSGTKPAPEADGRS